MGVVAANLYKFIYSALNLKERPCYILGTAGEQLPYLFLAEGCAFFVIASSKASFFSFRVVLISPLAMMSCRLWRHLPFKREGRPLVPRGDKRGSLLDACSLQTELNSQFHLPAGG